MSLHPPPIVTPPPDSGPSSAQIVTWISQFLISGFVGIMLGLFVPLLTAQEIGGNKPFDDFRIPGVMLGVALVMLIGGILASVRRIWLLGGLLGGTSLGLGCIGLLFLFYTIVQTA